MTPKFRNSCSVDRQWWRFVFGISREVSGVREVAHAKDGQWRLVLRKLSPFLLEAFGGLIIPQLDTVLRVPVLLVSCDSITVISTYCLANSIC